MKYMVTFQYPHKPSSAYDTRTAFKVFDTIPQFPDLKYLGYFGRLDGHGGFVLVETDNPALLLQVGLRFQPFFEYYIYPLLEMADFANISRGVNNEVATIIEESEREQRDRDKATP